jgi:glycosyltransferase involved in cell wall biosynthesis
MMHRPFFSVVMAAYNRGRHIRPSIESVLGQTFTDFELLVVGDGCIDTTQEAVEEFASSKLSWRNLEQNSGSQSAPNNEGLRHARGRWICYIGHDDVWASDHLQRIREVIASHGAVDFVISGCIYYGPPESDIHFVTGMFEQPDAPLHHFFPPSATAHRRDVPDRIGSWQEPRSVKDPVDADFQLRAARAGLRFRSTGAVTVHKFAAGHRYLSYLRQTSAEQSAVLRALQSGESGWVEEIVEQSKRAGWFMAMRHDLSQHEKGYVFEYNRSNKGLARAALRPLPGRTVIEQTDEPRGLDWYFRDAPGIRHRWSGPNPRPKILIPFTGGAVRAAIDVTVRPGGTAEGVSVFVEGEKVDCEIAVREAGAIALVFPMRLKASDYTVFTLHTPIMFRPADVFPAHPDDVRKLGIAVGNIVLEPV